VAYHSHASEHRAVEFPTHGNDVESFIALADYASDSVAAKGGNGVLLAPNV
jgi:hypothetical protein